MSLTFEQPLNEKIRNYLRIETVAGEVKAHATLSHPGAEMAYFRTLFELAELLERADLRSDLLKDLERQLTQIELWRPLPSVDHAQLDLFEQQLQNLQRRLQAQTRPTQVLKNDRFLSALRQRMTIPGGYGNFDLPQLHFWLAQDSDTKAKQSQAWLATLAPVLDSVALSLKLLRQTGRWQEQLAIRGSYQASSEQGLDLLQVRVKQEYGVYPTISAHRHRFTIHLINHETGKADSRNLPIQLCLSLESK
ncbi:cell division protein ZapD [Ferrimonas marina]|uniref:Cell division protein ZapD n=1 Tax=Ferrimonas marina TaxID=299255 RepID=A0A1M5XF89_9GAMM|nr:cell division protein ZapD [Ferrimonas marina]SHH98461.1 cell division protein ZapD [Ferrimonas marina]